MAASRPVVTLRLSASLREKVLRSGYCTVADLRSVPIQDLATELKLSPEQTQELSHQLHPPSTASMPAITILTLEKETKWTPITTSSKALDSLFVGGQGIPLGKITEICGLAGSGKTQIGIQLCINAQIPCNAGGVGGTVIYVDTEGSFVAKRALQVASACAERLRPLPQNAGDTTTTVTTNSLMQGIQYCRVHSAVELVAMVRMLNGIVQSHPKTKLIVVDSIAFLFRSNFTDTHARTKLVASLGRQLTELAREHAIAVVVMNHMTTRLESNQEQRIYSISESSSGGSGVQPALGESWGNLCTHRIRLYHNHSDGRRSARLLKSPTIQEQSVSFQIGREGIMDVKDTSAQVLGSPVEENVSFSYDAEDAVHFWDE
ncbi:P-loop containing nucleoside triphosphate hydrolase protein [Mortierella sp. GBAus27b]|nr:P-loop containing nucleoside triphosphate hydrolase protein [Mortierella sp. GBAus27b]